MERPEDFEERQESETEVDGESERTGGDAARVDEDRSREGRFGDAQRAGGDESDPEERRTGG